MRQVDRQPMQFSLHAASIPLLMSYDNRCGYLLPFCEHIPHFGLLLRVQTLIYINELLEYQWPLLWLTRRNQLSDQFRPGDKSPYQFLPAPICCSKPICTLGPVPEDTRHSVVCSCSLLRLLPPQPRNNEESAAYPFSHTALFSNFEIRKKKSLSTQAVSRAAVRIWQIPTSTTQVFFLSACNLVASRLAFSFALANNSTTRKVRRKKEKGKRA